MYLTGRICSDEELGGLGRCLELVGLREHALISLFAVRLFFASANCDRWAIS